MSACVYPEFLQHIQAQGLYVDGYNYEEMYNIMVYNLTNNFIPSFSFIYSYEQIDELYDYLDNLLHPMNNVNEYNDNEDNEIQQPNQTNQINNPTDNDTDSDSIYSDSDYSDEIQITPTSQYTQPSQSAQQLLSSYLASLVQPNINNYNYNANIVHYDNTTNYTNSNLYTITYLNNSNNTINTNLTN